MENDKWIIWSIEHQAWWGPDEAGYVPKKKDAGLYSYEEALRIVKSANISNFDVPNEVMVLVQAFQKK